MTKSESLKRQFKKAVTRFEEVLGKKKDDITRDSSIKRFEMVFDLSWKLLKELLEYEKGVVCNSPKDCFRAAYKSGLIEYDELWMDMTDWRNEAVHTYSEEFADNLYKKFSKTLERFQYLEKVLDGE